MEVMTEFHPAGEGLRLAFELFAYGEDLMRRKFRREHRHASEAEIEELVCAWLSSRPCAEFGDAEGVPGTWPRPD